jgi:signal transduction histidine kinase
MDNLLSNSIKYAPQSPIKIHLCRENQNAVLRFIDFGPGIPEKYAEGVFERFFRVPGRGSTIRGSGLGLFICKKIIQAHNGKITVESTPGNGATFVVILPLI